MQVLVAMIASREEGRNREVTDVILVDRDCCGGVWLTWVMGCMVEMGGKRHGDIKAMTQFRGKEYKRWLEQSGVRRLSGSQWERGDGDHRRQYGLEPIIFVLFYSNFLLLKNSNTPSLIFSGSSVHTDLIFKPRNL